MSVPNETFLRQRIVFKAKKHGLPTHWTRWWDDAPSPWKTDVQFTRVNPVLYSVSSSGDMTIIGTAGVLIIRREVRHLLLLTEIQAVDNNELLRGKDKREFAELEITTKNGEVYLAPTEKGPSCFAIWNILLILQRMSSG